MIDNDDLPLLGPPLDTSVPLAPKGLNGDARNPSAAQLKCSFKCGSLPTKDEHRCARIRRDGTRCKRYRWRGSLFCGTHGAKAQRRREKRRKDGLQDGRANYLPDFYKGRLTGTLAAFVQECIESPPHEQLSLYRELALTRHQAGQAVALYNAAVSIEPGQVPEEKRLEALSISGEMMKETLKFVAEMTQRAAVVEGAAVDKITVHHLAYVISQIVRITYRVLGDSNMALAREIDKAVRAEIKLPRGDQRGTGLPGDGTVGVTVGVTLTPSMVLDDVIEMDETVPVM